MSPFRPIYCHRPGLPKLNYSLAGQISGVPLVGQQEVPKLSFIKTSFKEAIKDSLVCSLEREVNDTRPLSF
jgi:hypothetical protein